MSSKIRYDDVLSRAVGIGTDLDVSVLEWIMRQIDASNDRIIRVRTIDFKKTLGQDCEKKNDRAIFMGLRRELKKYGIYVKLRTYKDGKIFMMSKENRNDQQ